MALRLPLRLLANNGGNFRVIHPYDPAYQVGSFDIISYTWGPETDPYKCDIEGVSWNVVINPRKLEDIKRLMKKEKIEFMWVDCVCLNQDNKDEMSVEIPKMYEYYKSASRCFILMDMEEVWNPQDIVGNLKFIDHILYHLGGASLASEAMLSPNLTQHLSLWANTVWKFPMDASTVRSAAIDMGILNCYATCISRVRELFDNLYFTRVWTFQEMLLGKNITLYGINGERVESIGELGTWMDLATDSKDKAYKLHRWIATSRILKTTSVNAILRIIEEDCVSLDVLQVQVMGISSARTDIINGGPYWWYENHKGISNIFSAISLTPRKCRERGDIFRGLLGVFSSLFSSEEIKRDMLGDDIEKISFAFFKQLSIKTKCAWTKLAISSGERGEWDWIPKIADSSKLLTTDCFAAVINLGRLKEKGLAKATATCGLIGTPRKYMRIRLKEGNRGFQFFFRGCNCGKGIKTGLLSKEQIPLNDQPRYVAGDETGRILVQCATVLGSLMDPEYNVVNYRRRYLRKLRPFWDITDPNAKPTQWEDRCVSGTGWENPDPNFFRVHNRSMNFVLGGMSDCGSRLQNESTASISCEVQVNCGCFIIAPFSFIFEAITAVETSSLGGISATLDADRIILRDGMGLVQVGDVGKSFDLVAFGGDVDAYRSHASSCKNTKVDKPVFPKLAYPRGRALVRDEFQHSLTDSMRDYGYVGGQGAGNLLVCRQHLMGQYKIVGVCIDDYIENKRGRNTVTIR